MLGPKGIPADAVDTILAPLSQDRDFYQCMEYYERLILQSALARHKKIPQITAALKIPRTTFDDKRKKYRI